MCDDVDSVSFTHVLTSFTQPTPYLSYLSVFCPAAHMRLYTHLINIHNIPRLYIYIYIHSSHIVVA